MHFPLEIRRLTRWLIAALWLAAFPAWAGALEGKRILVLYAYGENIPAYTETTDGLTAAFTAAGGSEEQLAFERLDLAHARSSHYRRAQLDLLRAKYAGAKLALIIAMHRQAVEFVLHDARGVLPEVPILAALVLPHEVDDLVSPRLHVLTGWVDFPGTVAMALRLFPGTRRVVYAGGVAPIDLARERCAREAVAQWGGKLSFESLNRLPRAAMMAKLATLPDHTVVLAGTLYQDRAGVVHAPLPFVAEVGARARVPVFNVFAHSLDLGTVVGGSMLDFTAEGRRVGRMAVALLGGPPVPAVTGQPEVPGLPMINWPLAERWGADLSRLPPGTKCLNRPQGLWQRHRGAIAVFLLVVVLLLMVLVVLLLVEDRRRRKNERQILTLKGYLANVIDSMPAMLVGLAPDGAVTQWNRQAELATGLPAGAALGQDLARVLPEFAPWIASMGEEVARDHRPASMARRSLDRAGESAFYDLMLYPLEGEGVRGAVVRIEDVTARTRIEALMIQSEKMMSVGGLAAGMAHEINNPLGIISAAAQNIVRRLATDLPANRSAAEAIGLDLGRVGAYFEQRKIPEFMANIQDAVGRANRIVANLVTFIREPDAATGLVSLPGLVQQALELAANDYDLRKHFAFRKIDIHCEVEPDLPGVPGVATELEQVLLNLLKNAAQAVHGNPPERPPRLDLRLWQEPPHLVLELRDNGPGMEEAVRRRVFEPFFSTREVGVGTGLGLSAAYMIITQKHRGLLEVASEPGQGARFTIRLPLAEGVRAGQAG